MLLYFDIMQSVNVDRILRFCVVLVSLWAYFYTLKCKNERIADFSEDRFSKVWPEMELYRFTELSNGWTSFKSGIFNYFISISCMRITSSFINFGRKWKKLIPQKICKNAINNNENFYNFWVTKIEIICKLHTFM